MARIIPWVFVVIFSVVGLWKTGEAAYTFYKDYQDFKVMRAYVAKKLAEERAAKAPPPQASLPDK